MERGPRVLQRAPFSFSRSHTRVGFQPTRPTRRIANLLISFLLLGAVSGQLTHTSFVEGNLLVPVASRHAGTGTVTNVEIVTLWEIATGAPAGNLTDLGPMQLSDLGVGGGFAASGSLVRTLSMTGAGNRQCSAAIGDGGVSNFDMIGIATSSPTGRVCAFSCIDMSPGGGIASAPPSVAHVTATTRASTTYFSSVTNQHLYVAPEDTAAAFVYGFRTLSTPYQGTFNSFNRLGNAVRAHADASMTAMAQYGNQIQAFVSPGWLSNSPGMYSIPFQWTGAVFNGLSTTLRPLVSFPTNADPSGLTFVTATTAFVVDNARLSEGQLFQYDLRGASWTQTRAVMLARSTKFYGMTSTGAYADARYAPKVYISSPMAIFVFDVTSGATGLLMQGNTDTRFRSVCMAPRPATVASLTPVPSPSTTPSSHAIPSTTPSADAAVVASRTNPSDAVYVVSVVSAGAVSAANAGHAVPVMLRGFRASQSNTQFLSVTLPHLAAAPIRCTHPGSAPSTAQPAISADGTKIAFLCYNAVASALGNLVAGTAVRKIAVVDVSNVSNPVTDLSSNVAAAVLQNLVPTSVATLDGNQFWFTAYDSSRTSTADGLFYIAGGSTTGTAVRVGSPSRITAVMTGAAAQGVHLVNGTLYVSTQAPLVGGVMRIASGSSSLPFARAIEAPMFRLSAANHDTFAEPTGCNAFTMTAWDSIYIACNAIAGVYYISKYTFVSATLEWKRAVSHVSPTTAVASSLSARYESWRSPAAEMVYGVFTATNSISSVHVLNTVTSLWATIYTVNTAAELLLGVVVRQDRPLREESAAPSPPSSPSPSKSTSKSVSATSSTSSMPSSSESATATVTHSSSESTTATATLLSSAGSTIPSWTPTTTATRGTTSKVSPLSSLPANASALTVSASPNASQSATSTPIATTMPRWAVPSAKVLFPASAVPPALRTITVSSGSMTTAKRALIGPTLPVAFVQLVLPYRPAVQETVVIRCEPGARLQTVARLRLSDNAPWPWSAPILPTVTVASRSISVADFTSTSAVDGAWTWLLSIASTAPSSSHPSGPIIDFVVCTVGPAGGAVPSGAAYSTLQTIKIPVVWMSIAWPGASDVLLDVEGGVRSAWGSDVVRMEGLNGTADELTAVKLEQLYAARRERAWGGSSFSLTLTRSSLITLAAHPTMPFPDHLAVSIRGTKARSPVLLRDRTMLRFQMPSKAELCPTLDASADCGALSMSITTNGTSPTRAAQLALADSVEVTSDGRRVLVRHADAVEVLDPIGVTITCPPLCPDLGVIPVPRSVVSSAENPNAAELTDARMAEGMPAPVGIYMTSACAAAGFTDPALGVCTNASHPLAASCAFGAGDACQRCPSGAVCPGGFRAWPRPGFWSPGVTSTAVAPCDAPAIERCPGFSSSLNAVPCGAGYRDGSFACTACAAQFYPRVDGTCAACPSRTDAAAVIIPILQFIASLVAIGGAVLLVVYAITRHVGGTLASGSKRCAKFLLAVISLLQVVVQVGRAASPGLPPFLRDFYGALAALQLEGITIHPACLGSSSKYTSARTQFAVITISLILLCIVQVNYARFVGCTACGVGRKPLSTSRKPLSPRNSFLDSALDALWSGKWADASKPAIRRALFTLLTLLYAMVCNTTLDILHCSSVSVSVQTYLSMDQDGAALRAQVGIDPDTLAAERVSDLCTSDADVSQCAQLRRLLDRVITVRVQARDPYQVCFEGQHRSIVGYAVVILLVYVLLYPAASYMIVQRRIQRGIKLNGLESEWNTVRRPPLVARFRAWCATVRANLQLFRSTTGVCCAFRARQRHLEDDLVDSCFNTQPDPSIAFWLNNDFRPSQFHFRHIDMLLLLILSAFMVAWSFPGSVASAVLRCLVSVTVIGAVTVLVLQNQPYEPALEWLQFVRILTLVLAAMGAIVNCLSYAAAAQPGTHGLGQAAEGAAIIVFAMSMLTALALVHSFFESIRSGSEHEFAARLANQENLGRRATARKVQWRLSGSVETPALLLGVGRQSHAPVAESQSVQDGTATVVWNPMKAPCSHAAVQEEALGLSHVDALNSYRLSFGLHRARGPVKSVDASSTARNHHRHATMSDLYGCNSADKQPLPTTESASKIAPAAGPCSPCPDDVSGCIQGETDATGQPQWSANDEEW